MLKLVSSKQLQEVLAETWGIEEMRARFRKSVQTIHNWRAEKDDPLPALVIPGGKRPALRFIPHEVEAWAKANGVKMYPRKRGRAA